MFLVGFFERKFILIEIGIYFDEMVEVFLFLELGIWIEVDSFVIVFLFKDNFILFFF